MNVTRIGNQDNRTNFKGLIQYIKDGEKVIVGSEFDNVVTGEIAKITRKQVKRVTQVGDGFHYILHLKNGTEVWYKVSGEIGVNDKASSGLLSFYSWSDYQEQAKYANFTPAKQNILALAKEILGF